MDAFSFLSVLLSIVIGLGLTQILTALGRLIRHRDRVIVDWIPLLWALLMLVVYMQVWWAMFGLRSHEHWTFLKFFFVLLQTVTLYMTAAVVLPEQLEEQGVDLRAYYHAQHRWMFGFFLATVVVSVCKDLVLNGEWPSTLNLAFHALLGGTSLLGMLTRHRRAHETIAVTAVAAMLSYIALLFSELR